MNWNTSLRFSTSSAVACREPKDLFVSQSIKYWHASIRLCHVWCQRNAFHWAFRGSGQLIVSVTKLQPSCDVSAVLCTDVTAAVSEQTGAERKQSSWQIRDRARRELRNVFFDGAYVIWEQTSVTVSVHFCWFHSVIYKIYSWLKRDYRKCLKEPNNIQTASGFNQSPSTPKSCHLADTLKSCQELNWAAIFTFT